MSLAVGSLPPPTKVANEVGLTNAQVNLGIPSIFPEYFKIYHEANTKWRPYSSLSHRKGTNWPRLQGLHLFQGFFRSWPTIHTALGDDYLAPETD